MWLVLESLVHLLQLDTQQTSSRFWPQNENAICAVCCVTFTISHDNKVRVHCSFFFLTGQAIKGLVPISRRVYHQIVQLHSNCSINCFLCMFKSKLTYLLKHSRRCFGSQGVRLSCKWGNAGMDRNERRKEERKIKRSCDILRSGCSVAQPVSLVTHESRFLCCCQNGVWGVCVLLYP